MLVCDTVTMNTNTTKLFTAALLAHLMCGTVILSHLHAKDAVSLLNQPGSTRLVSTDITAKVVGDLHQHIDKASLKNVTANTATTAARQRELSPLSAEELETGVVAQFQDFILRFRIVASLCYQAI